MDANALTKRKKFLSKDTLLMFGPAWLVMMADMDASSYIGAAQTGATLGYGLIWLMLVLIIPLYVVQELAGRISIATRSGLGEVVRENYGKRVASIVAMPMALTDMFTYGIEYLGIGIGLEIMGLSLYYTIPVIYIIHILIVTRKRYNQAEKPLLIISLILIVALLASLFYRGIMPLSSPMSNPLLIKPAAGYFFLLAANVGAVIMPFMIFFQASATGLKLTDMSKIGISIKSHRSVKIMRRETLVGAIVTELLMVIAEMAFTGIPHAASSSFFATPQELGKVLVPIAGSLSPFIFGIGIIAAGFIALITISLGSAWGIAESLNISKKSYWLVYVLESLPAVIAVIIINPSSLIALVLYLLIFFVFTLVAPMIMLWIIGRNKKIMGELVLSRKNEALYLAMFILIISTAVIAVATSL
ncbi:MAG: divalent metal cation transporter [Ferroplasma sp.]|uniref:NRAMP family divalent metal transporter n=1 Tax=Ferroplasma sp. TaxID=2591003 RepID=UPI0028153368|nr:divalent metal cation transporter [Ferroplasma sp.]WMT51478.1 MAG: divalent metal cation transporter [Ferroplasma sp.]